MAYKPKYFTIQELVNPRFLEEMTEEQVWALLDDNALEMLDALREKFGPITVNNWSFGGRFKDSGLRHPESKVGAKGSAHKQGKAFDCKFSKAKLSDVHAYILENQAEFPKIKRLECLSATPTWLHFDTRDSGRPGIHVFKP